jgi:hypothetical protein
MGQNSEGEFRHSRKTTLNKVFWGFTDLPLEDLNSPSFTVFVALDFNFSQNV